MTVTINETPNHVIISDPTHIKVVSVGTPGPASDLGAILVGVGSALNEITVASSSARDLFVSGNAQVGGNVVIGADLVPDGDETRSLGAPDLKWKDIYVSDGTIFIGVNSSISGSSISIGAFNVAADGSISIPGVNIAADANAVDSVSISASDLASRLLLEAEILAAVGDIENLGIGGSNAVSAINSLFDYTNALIGDISSANVATALASLSSDIGSLSSLSTSDKSSLVVALNETYALAQSGGDSDPIFNSMSIGNSVYSDGGVTSNSFTFSGDVIISGSLSVDGAGDDLDLGDVLIANSNVSTAANTLTLSSASGEIELQAPLTFNGTQFDTVITPNVSVGESIVSSFSKERFHFAKLVINTQDLTYGQTQISEVLLTHDGTNVRLTEYAILHTSTNPFVTYNAAIESGNVVVKVSTQSTDNLIKITRILN